MAVVAVEVVAEADVEVKQVAKWWAPPEWPVMAVAEVDVVEVVVFGLGCGPLQNVLGLVGVEVARESLGYVQDNPLA